MSCQTTIRLPDELSTELEIARRYSPINVTKICVDAIRAHLDQPHSANPENTPLHVVCRALENAMHNGGISADAVEQVAQELHESVPDQMDRVNQLLIEMAAQRLFNSAARFDQLSATPRPVKETPITLGLLHQLLTDAMSRQDGPGHQLSSLRSSIEVLLGEDQ